MPNHITTVAYVTGPDEQVEAFRAAHITLYKDVARFDFDTIIPMPESVKATILDWKPGQGPMFGDLEVETYAKGLLTNRRLFLLPHEKPSWLPESVKKWGDLLAHYDATKPGIDVAARAQLRCAAETGYPGWYEWSCANWGTKWDAYDYKERVNDLGRFVFKFETAWSPPVPILTKLAEMWPKLTIETKSIDEGGGAWAGIGGHLESVEETRELHIEVYGNAERIDPEEDEEERHEKESASS